MHSSTALFIALFSSLSQQLSDLDYGNRLQNRHAMIQARQSGQDLSYCFGTTAICPESSNLFDDCSPFIDQPDQAQWFQCICGNGYVTADTQCDWCQEAYDLDFVNNEELHTSGCSQYNGGTIAPLPSSVIAAVSAWNATYTGVISGGANTATGGSDSAVTSGSGPTASKTGGSATRQTTSSAPKNTRSSSSSSISHTVTFYETLNGGSPGTLTAALTSNQGGVETSMPSTTLKAGSGSGGSQGWSTGVAVMFSVVAFGFSALCLL